MGNSNGDFAEEFFYNALLRGKRNILGEEFDEVMKKSNVTFNKGFEDEYDILLVNGRAVCIVEVKYKADSKDLPQKVSTTLNGITVTQLDLYIIPFIPCGIDNQFSAVAYGIAASGLIAVA